MNRDTSRALLLAVAAAALYALSAPVSKLILAEAPPSMLAGLLYSGAGIGMAFLWLMRRHFSAAPVETPLSRSDLPYVCGMILLDIVAPILLMSGLSSSSPAAVSLLGNFEIVATSIIAFLIFGERISGRLWLAIALITCASFALSLDTVETLSFSPGSMLVLLACLCWGFENNCTRRLSEKDPLQIVMIKGLGSGTGALIIAFSLGEGLPAPLYAAASLLLGFVSYGLSIFCYVYAQRSLGAAKTSAFYAAAPFIGALLSFIIFSEPLSPIFIVALLVMLSGAYFAAKPDKVPLKDKEPQ